MDRWGLLGRVAGPYRTRGARTRSSVEPFVPMNCVADSPYPTCGDQPTGEHGETIGLYVNVSQRESTTGEVGFPAGGLGSYTPNGYEKLSGLNESEPSYSFGEHDEATPLSNPDVAPLADELEMAYGLQSTLLPGLEGGIVPSPIAPGEPPLELHQNRSTCGKPVDCGRCSRSGFTGLVSGRPRSSRSAWEGVPTIWSAESSTLASRGHLTLWQ